MIHKGGVGFVEGVELYRMGQTNVLGRYPIHFHQLRECPECYFKESSVHRSYYRCISIHATNSTTVSENVAYDIIGYCYYLEDGVETKNMFAFNMAAHIHMILPDQPQTSDSHLIDVYKQSDELTLPADVTAGGFYITNLDNNFIGNSVSGGWSGYVIVNLPAPVGRSQEIPIRPFLAAGMIFDGNIAHSTSWWWENAGALYIGGSLFFDENDVLSFNAGRDLNLTRDPCKTHTPGPCAPKDQLWMKFTNTKVYLTPAAAIQSWSGRLEVVGYETHDVGRALNIYANDFWVDNMLAVCRTGEPIALPPSAATTRIPGNGFEWTNTEHIVTNSTFRRCGYRSTDFAQYDNGPDRGCGDDNLTGCSPTSAVFNIFAQSDRNNPDLMQASSEIVMEDCGRRFRLGDFGDGTLPSTVSSRIQNWIDVDGSVTGFNEHSLIVSGLEDCGLWWSVDDNVVDDVQGPLKFIKTSEGPERGLGHIHLEWNDGLHAEVGKSLCGHVNTDPCPAVGSIRHLGPRFANNPGLPVTASADIIGPVGGYGWLLELDGGAPRKMTLSQVEVDPATPLLLSVAYPLGTMFRITASAPAWCSLLEDARYSCSNFRQCHRYRRFAIPPEIPITYRPMVY